MSARRVLVWLGLVLALVAIAAGIAFGWSWTRLNEPFKGFSETEKTVIVESGQSARAIFERLAAEGVLQHATLTRLYFRYVLEEPALQAGEYRFSGAATASQILDKLSHGEVVLHEVTLLEGLTLEEIAATLTANGFGTLDAFLAAMRSVDLIRDLDPQATDLEGYLFPDTYAFARGTSETEIVATLVGTFRRRFEKDVRVLLSAERQLESPRDLVSLASIIEKETLVDSERAVVAGVYTNRLERSIALYADPTVIFALKRLGTWDGNIRRTDLRIDHPYNTYVHTGLPPGPICSPGLASLRAAAQPAEVPYLYFVSRNDGTHVFSSTLAEHNRAVNKWQRQYWREKWAAEKRK
ncbi:MAG: endolytic transglycosylase MltG [Acidobacteriota bacterium]|nr:endolytic transglycosylase MltG [Acidobacteriota bacterium]